SSKAKFIVLRFVPRIPVGLKLLNMGGCLTSRSFFGLGIYCLFLLVIHEYNEHMCIMQELFLMDWVFVLMQAIRKLSHE
ncbi:MAG: hypothetical protein KAI81_00750, partial [Candidatus Marinimicrobia bacterium]|nr:hypothetical protein [Candidatus Neomarinimicrobiota bacterium]